MSIGEKLQELPTQAAMAMIGDTLSDMFPGAAFCIVLFDPHNGEGHFVANADRIEIVKVMAQIVADEGMQ